MSIKSRTQQQATLYYRFYTELTKMDYDLVKLFCQWTFAMCVLYLVYINTVHGGVGVLIAGFSIGIDIPRTVEAWKRARANIREENA